MTCDQYPLLGGPLDGVWRQVPLSVYGDPPDRLTAVENVREVTWWDLLAGNLPPPRHYFYQLVHEEGRFVYQYRGEGT